LHRILTTAAEIASWYGLSIQEVEAILHELEALGTLVSVPDSPGDRPSSLVPHPASLLWASPEHLEGAYIATLARRRREARPASLAQYQRCLLMWQHRSGNPLAGEEGVREVLAQLQGLPLPATVWEGEVLARRVLPYQPGRLDRACETGEFVWQG